MAAADRSRLSFTSSSGSEEDEAIKANRRALRIDEATGRYEIADPVVRAADARHRARVKLRHAAAAEAARDARAAAAQDAYEEAVRQQMERDRLARNPHPQSFEAAASHLHETPPKFYAGKEEIYWHAFDRSFLSTRWNEEHVNSYNPVVFDNYVVMVPAAATAGEHRFVFPTWDLDPQRYWSRGGGYYGAPVQQWCPVRLDFRYPFPSRHPTPSPERTPSLSENEQDEDDGNY
jgi:hypothetical protein